MDALPRDYEVAQNIRRMREDRMPKAVFARRLITEGWPGKRVQPGQVNQIETAGRTLTMGELEIVARALDTSVRMLLRPPETARYEDHLEAAIMAYRDNAVLVETGVRGIMEALEDLEEWRTLAANAPEAIRTAERVLDLIGRAEDIARPIPEIVERAQAAYRDGRHGEALSDEFPREEGY
jgi:hypothetical protein